MYIRYIMNEKEQLIHQLINDGRASLERTLKEHEEWIEDYRKNGLPKDCHPSNEKGYESGLTYTQGYCIGHLELLKKINSLLESNTDEIKDVIEENKRIEEENRKHMDEVLSKIKAKYSDRNKD